jgi:hypothetical protein
LEFATNFYPLLGQFGRSFARKSSRHRPYAYFSDELKLALERVIRNDTEWLTYINAGNALLEYRSITKESLGTKKYLGIYGHLRNEDKAK